MAGLTLCLAVRSKYLTRIENMLPAGPTMGDTPSIWLAMMFGITLRITGIIT